MGAPDAIADRIEAVGALFESATQKRGCFARYCAYDSAVETERGEGGSSVLGQSLRSLFVLVFLASGLLGASACSSDSSSEPPSIARAWNDALLAAIRGDFARPTVHARNLFHSSALMYDLWAVYDETADPYFLGRTVGGSTCPLPEAEREQLRAGSPDIDAARETAIAYGMYRLLSHRFRASPGASVAQGRFDRLMTEQGYGLGFDSRDFSDGNPASLGLYAADCVIEYGLRDGANERVDYVDDGYEPVNPPLDPTGAGAAGLVDPNRWQPLELEGAIDQSGNPVSDGQIFLGAHWGRVVPFALDEDDYVQYSRDGEVYPVCHDPGAPVLLGEGSQSEDYLWHHSMVALWSSHLDPADGVMWDVSPANIGNTTALPEDPAAMRDFYDALEGGSTDRGHAVNPYTGEPYESQWVPRGDYARVLAEFWADGPGSETPPGHWFVIVNEAVNDHPALARRYRGEELIVDALEWDVKLYFTLGGALHDAAIAAWSIKAWYDYVRPVSAIRYMASLGQSSNPAGASYHPNGIPLVEGTIELVEPGDALAADDAANVGKIKVLAWRGPEAIRDPNVDVAGVGWILAERWWPYQRPSFVTPPFAGYVSGHSTFSRTAAEVLTAFTGDPFFPGGMGEFAALKDEFLVFERGPSTDVVLQWATYRDASDQTSLSRIWGGIHPPIDDVPGRQIGIRVAADALALADAHFRGVADTR